MNFDVAAFVARVRAVLPATRPMPLHDPWLAGGAFSVAKCVSEGWVSGNGHYVEAFEHMLAERLGVPHVIATNTGTAALHVALLCAGVNRGHQIMAPALSFAATANAVLYCGGDPYFNGADAAVGRHFISITVDFLGHVRRPSGSFGARIIEDAAQALGSENACQIGYIAVLSFNGNKIITTGQGGALVTRDPEIAQRARHLVNVAKIGNSVDAVGFNYRMPDLNAALGVAQLSSLDDILAKKRALAERYFDAFAGMAAVEPVHEPPGCRSNYWLNAVLLPDEAARDEAAAALNAAGVETRIWRLLTDMPPYRDCPKADLSTAREIAGRLLCLPSGASAVQ